MFYGTPIRLDLGRAVTRWRVRYLICKTLYDERFLVQDQKHMNKIWTKIFADLGHKN